MLPIIDMNPTDRSYIVSTLLFISDQSLQLQINTPCVTFDQPLWLKAVEIVEAEKLNIVCRLGSFHTMIIFLGRMNNIMSGSGLDKVLECIYSSNVMNQILTGKTFSRAIRGHFLVHSALLVALMRTFMVTKANDDDNTMNEGDIVVSKPCDIEVLSQADFVSLQGLFKKFVNG